MTHVYTHFPLPLLPFHPRRLYPAFLPPDRTLLFHLPLKEKGRDGHVSPLELTQGVVIRPAHGE